MNKKLLIDVQQRRTKVALVENSQLVEFHVEKSDSYNIVGNIYKGRVMNVLPGMQAAFVDVGLEKNAFLYVGDMMADKSELVGADLPQELSVKEGDVIMVQVVKDRMGTKGARVSHNITLPGRLLVLMPSVNYIGISKKITDKRLRENLYDAMQKIKLKGMGFIVRTAAAKARFKDLKAEAQLLISHWQEILEKFEKAKVSDALHYESDLVSRTLRDLYTDDINEIVVNDGGIGDRIARLLGPRARKSIVVFPKDRDMFHDMGLTEQIDSMLDQRVKLESGAYLIINRTEALTVIDVNTGKYVGDANLEETVFKTNLLAAKEIAKQLRLRNIGGIIVVDFIDMESDEHRRQVLDCLEEELKKDRVKTTVVGMSGLGLVEITRKKTRNEIAANLLQTCPYCNGNGYVYSHDHIVSKISVAIIDAFQKPQVRGILVSCNPAIVDYVFKNRVFAEYLSMSLNRNRIYFSSDYNMHTQHFKVKEFHTNEFDLPQNSRYLAY